jgi:hypothetical protein
VASVPISVAPSKNSTFATEPPGSAAVALTVTLAGATKTALLAGALRLTVGGASTVMLTTVEVVTPLLLSVALAVSA